jgi:tetratricopeptide (TPR) repeat protein
VTLPLLTFSRRRFLQSAAVLPAIACLSRQTAIGAKPPKAAPHTALAPYILPGSDEFPEEKIAFEHQAALTSAFRLKQLPVAPRCKGISPAPVRYEAVAADLKKAVFAEAESDLVAAWRHWIDGLGAIRRAQFYILPDDVVRFEIASSSDGSEGYRVGSWHVAWEGSEITRFEPLEEHLALSSEPWFRDVTAYALGQTPALADQFGKGTPYWRARLDPASGIDVYGSNGIAVGDIDNDGYDEIYVCQGGGLPNRLLKVHPDGAVTDLTEAWGVGLLDDTSCALFLDLRNSGRQDLVVLRSSGPVLFLNEGARYRLRTDAFEFATAPRGGFTGMAAADYDRDGKLDLYLCCYVYFQSEAQYTYPSPYHDARNGPPNFLFRNELDVGGSGNFRDVTAEVGLDQNNDRFSFAPAWCDSTGDGWPDLYVANDFGCKNFYRNRQGRFRDEAAQAGVADVGPGMSAAWFDYDGDGQPDLYVANMWTDAGLRVTADEHFKPAEQQKDAYRGHTMGNSLFHNKSNGMYEDTTAQQHAGFGRWAWSSGGHDLDNDGRPEIAITCGMLTNTSTTDLSSFFWRQVVACSPDDASPSAGYEKGWNAINQFLREDLSWNGREPNVVHARRGDRFFDFSGVSGFDFADDSRAFAVTDFDGDGRPDIILKSRLGPQLRLLQNNCAGVRSSIAFRLRGIKSNRDAIGARVEIDGQAKWLDAGSGFLSQHSKRMIFGLGSSTRVQSVKITWPSGLMQDFSDLQAGRSYSVAEGSTEITSEPFRAHQALPVGALDPDNGMRLHDTWLLQPVPLPVKSAGPGLFVIREKSQRDEIFRRYLFDWRAPLDPPLALLLNQDGEAVKVYGSVPSAEKVRADLRLLVTPVEPRALPYGGFFIKQPKRDYFKFGAGFLWAGMPTEALPYLERVLQQTPENARVWTLVGQIQLELDHTDQARRAFNKAAGLDPASVNAWIGLGDVSAKRDKQQEAADSFRKALTLDPQSAEAANGLGLASAKLGDVAMAQQQFERAISIRRDYAEAINNLAVLFAQRGKLNDAVAAWQYGIRVAPDEDILYLNLGRTYINMGQKDNARTTMQQLLDRDQGNETARRALQELNTR